MEEVWIQNASGYFPCQGTSEDEGGTPAQKVFGNKTPYQTQSFVNLNKARKQPRNENHWKSDAQVGGGLGQAELRREGDEGKKSLQTVPVPYPGYFRFQLKAKLIR